MTQFDESQIALMKEKREKEVKMFSILKEIAAYTVYLLIVTVLVYDNVDPNSFRTNDYIKKAFVAKKFERVNIDYLLVMNHVFRLYGLFYY